MARAGAIDRPTRTWDTTRQMSTRRTRRGDGVSAQITGVHPYADKFPMLPDQELDELAESIKANGLRNPIVLTPDGLILDGRNRFAACERAGITDPTTTVYEGDDLAEYVIDCNSSRRHMSTGARAMATALVLVAANRRNDGRWQRGSVDIGRSPNIETWRDALKRAGVILDHAPDLAEQVVTGSVALDAAFRTAVQNRDAERAALEAEERERAQEAEARAFVEQNAPDLAARVNGTDLQSYREAEDLWKRRNREEAEKRRKKREAEERERENYERDMRTEFTGIAETVARFARYGSQDDPLALFDKHYQPRFVRSPTPARDFTPESCETAARFLVALAGFLQERNR